MSAAPSIATNVGSLFGRSSEERMARTSGWRSSSPGLPVILGHSDDRIDLLGRSAVGVLEHAQGGSPCVGVDGVALAEVCSAGTRGRGPAS